MDKDWRWVYNPFEKIAGWKAFGIGIVILCLATAIGYFGNTVFYGFSIKAVPSITWSKAFLLQATGLTTTVLVMWITALLFAKHVRFQDILGTVTLAKYPLVLPAIMFLAIGKRLNELGEKLSSTGNHQETMKLFNELTVADYALFIFIIVVSILVLVWSIALLFNAFKVSTNLKGIKCALLFIAIMLISEIVIHIMISKI